MMNLRKILLLYSLLMIFSFAFSQGEFSLTREPDNYNVNIFAVKLNTNGFGLDYNFQMRKHYRLRRVIDVEYNYLIDIKNIKLVNEQFQTFNKKTFVFGKLYSAHNINLGYGYNRMFFEKRDNNSVSIHLYGTCGFSFCFLKPIYYQKFNINTMLVDYEKFDINSPNGNYDIIGRAPFYLGLNEMKIVPGIYAKIAVDFDFAKDIMRTSILSVGVELNAYIKKIEIMAENARYFIPQLYIMYSFGKKYDSKLNREFRKEMRKQERKNK